MTSYLVSRTYPPHACLLSTGNVMRTSARPLLFVLQCLVLSLYKEQIKIIHFLPGFLSLWMHFSVYRYVAFKAKRSFFLLFCRFCSCFNVSLSVPMPVIVSYKTSLCFSFYTVPTKTLEFLLPTPRTGNKFYTTLKKLKNCNYISQDAQ